MDAAKQAVRGTANWKREDLDPDDLSTRGLIRLLEIIGEAANSVSTEVQLAHPSVPWRRLTGLRNRLIHGYFNVNLDILWDTIRGDLPELIRSLTQVREKLE
ncbi:MAG: HepT-like ribonuclease domain-containing protein [Planctomycetota bacterium]